MEIDKNCKRSLNILEETNIVIFMLHFSKIVAIYFHIHKNLNIKIFLKCDFSANICLLLYSKYKLYNSKEFDI